MENILQSLFVLLSAGAVTIVVFIACRELICWYFKINRIVEDLHVIANHYRGAK